MKKNNNRIFLNKLNSNKLTILAILISKLKYFNKQTFSLSYKRH